MSHAANPADFHSAAFVPARRAPVASAAVPSTAHPDETAPRKSLLRRFFDSLMWSRERQSQRDIDRLVSWRDGGFNDAFEREIAEKFYSDGWGFRR